MSYQSDSGLWVAGYPDPVSISPAAPQDDAPANGLGFLGFGRIAQMPGKYLAILAIPMAVIALPGICMAGAAAVLIASIILQMP
jgi:hypothetical protein